MPALTFTRNEFDAFVACWEAGHRGLPDRRWLAVELAIHDALGDLEGVDMEIDGEALDDARAGFAAGWDGYSQDDPGEDRAADMEGAAVVLDIVPAPGMRH